MEEMLIIVEITKENGMFKLKCMCDKGMHTFENESLFQVYHNAEETLQEVLGEREEW
jgi:hypothetical protein